MESLNPKWTEETIVATLHSSNREMRALRKAHEQSKSKGKVNEKSFQDKYKDLQKKIDLYEVMLSSIREEQTHNSPTFPSPKKTAFSSTGLRDFQRPDKITKVPNFYKGQHEWEFGLETRHKTLEMNAFQFQEQNSFDRDEELLNDASVFVGSARSHSRVRPTDFFGPHANSLMKHRLSTQNINPLSPCQTLRCSTSRSISPDARSTLTRAWKTSEVDFASRSDSRVGSR